MDDLIIAVTIILFVVGGWGAIILKDFAIAREETKGNWVYSIVAIIFAVLLIWIATVF